MFCPQCGSSEKEMWEGLCIDCFLKDFNLISIAENIEVTTCAHCASNLKEGKWREMGIPEEEIIYRALEDHIKIDEISEDVEIDLEILQIKGSSAQCIIKVDGNVLGKSIHQEYHSSVKLKKTVCPDCSKFIAGYYEAVIQLRATNRPLTPEEIRSADETINDVLERLWEKNRLAYLAQRSEMKEGIDYYIGSQKSAKKVISALREVLGGTVKESPRLMGQDKSTGKGLYRTWMSLRLPEFEIGDFVIYENKTCRVVAIDSRKISVMDLSQLTRLSILWKEYDNIETLKKSEDIQKTTVTSKSPQEIQILHPETFQPIDLEIKPRMKDLEIGDEVSVIELNNEIYIITE
ncbi:60S ribosomal export protein NMD3 [Methanobacterium alcaliphilum]|uniref:60S ribosomal export protein NMD3 n=1 Tax=Methanobacterium alcaliphilum TaxID=392018 RepID=UPI00200B9B98|nr:60S ribosomal export protein NMD3 [Methanobacterium alcaliphilum]MCK9152296.1 hypothetical protein [Methanobacterium alcaliphilum]